MPQLDNNTLDLGLTIFALIALSALFLRGRAVTGRPADPLNPRMIPWNMVMIACAFAMLLAIVHLVNLLGIQTGPRPR